MFKPVSGGPAVVVCNTCRHSPDSREDEHGRRGGAKLAEALRTARASDARYAGIAVQEMACLFACKDYCTVHLRAPGKLSYVMGRFTPGEASARAILDYAVHYAASEHGQVRFADWPEGVKGHFITRSPPHGFITE